MAAKESTSTGGIGFVGALTLLFIGLKLTGFIDWSWWAVLAPLWIPVALWLVIVAVLLVACEYKRRRFRRLVEGG